MNKAIALIQLARTNIYVAVATAIISVIWGLNWTGTTQELIRQDNFFREGCVEVSVEGISENSLRDAEDDSKKKAMEKANGLFIKYQRSHKEKNKTTMDDDKSGFKNSQEDEDDLLMTGDSDFVSIDYLERTKKEDGLYHVKIKAVVKLRPVSESEVSPRRNNR